MVQALRVARTHVFSEARQNISKFAILLTDGTANNELSSTQDEADLLKAQNINIFCVGISSRV